MNALVVAAADPSKSPDGAMGLVVFLILAVVVVFLFRSMNRHLRKVRNIDFDDAGSGRGSRGTQGARDSRAGLAHGKPQVVEPRKPGAS